MQKIQVQLVDDIDGSDADETVTFALDGVSYEIDLTAAHAADFRDALAGWKNAARRLPSRRQPRRSAPSAGRHEDVREWARAHGFDVRPKGRVSREVLAAYEAAQHRNEAS